MTIDVKIVVEDVSTQLITYNTIQLERASSVSGTYTLQASTLLVSGQYYYTLTDTGADINSWFRYRFFHSVSLVVSLYSDPFRVDGVSRLRIRQGVLDKYGAGIIVLANGGDTNTLLTTDSRVVSASMRANRLKGLWLLPTTGALLGQSRIISATVQSASNVDISINPDWSGAMLTGIEVEIHYLADPKALNDAINRGLARYYWTDRVPLTGVSTLDEYNLDVIPWLYDKDQVHDVRWYPNDSGVDESYAAAGKWFKVRKDADRLVLSVSPRVATGTTLWLETTRPMPPLYTDVAALPATCVEELAIALAWDELMAYLTRPTNGTSEERKSWQQERIVHSVELNKLLKRHRPKPAFSPPQFTQPPTVPHGFRSR